MRPIWFWPVRKRGESWPMPPVVRARAERVLARVAGEHNMSVRTMIDRSQLAYIVAARTEAVHRLRAEVPGLTLGDIARLVGYRQPAAVIHALRKGAGHA